MKTSSASIIEGYWGPVLAGVAVLGAVVGPVLLTHLAFRYRVWRYQTEAEFWDWLFTVPTGCLFGFTIAVVLALWTHRLHRRAFARSPLRSVQRWLPLRRRWLWYLLLPGIYVGSLILVGGLVYAGLILIGDFVEGSGYLLVIALAWAAFVWLIILVEGRIR